MRTNFLTRGLAIARRPGLILVIALLTGLPGTSELQPRPVTGVVTDKRGNALPGAAVQLKNTVSLLVRSYITRQDGRFVFTGLNSDVDYTLRAKYREHWSDTKTLSKFDNSMHPEVNLTIPID